MTQSRNEQTIARMCEVHGRGYWTGHQVRVVMRPASSGSGIVLVRSDLPNQPSCKAVATNRHDTQLRTIVQSGDARFEMVEHLLAALYAHHVDNCLVEIDCIELPGLDGSSDAYSKAIESVGVVTQDKARQRLVIQDSIEINAGNRWIRAEPIRDDLGGCYFEYQLQFDAEGPISAQKFGFHCSPKSFQREVASARTFVTQSQAESLRAQGVAGHVSNKDLLVFGENGPIDNELRFQDECARHKTLDLIGDLALVGVDIVGSIVSHRGGHSLNGMLAEELLKIVQEQTSSDAASQRKVA